MLYGCLALKGLHDMVF